MKTLKAGILTVFLTGAITGILADKKIVCYYDDSDVGRGDGYDISDIDPTLCTHITYTLLGIENDGQIYIEPNRLGLPPDPGYLQMFTKHCKSSPGTKAMASVSWSDVEFEISKIVGNPEFQAQFIQNVVNFLKKYDFDGLDIPYTGGKNSSEEWDFVIFLKALKEAFNNYGYTLSVAVSAKLSLSRLNHIANMTQNVDFINLFTLNYNGWWQSVTGIYAPLSNVSASVQYWLSEGASADKLVVAVPFYGCSFTLTNPENNGIGAPTKGRGDMSRSLHLVGVLTYSEICENVRQGWAVKRDEEGSPYAFSGDQWVSYDDQTSIAKKADYVLSNGLGGIVALIIDVDDFRGTCGEKYPLLTAINEVLREVKIAVS